MPENDCFHRCTAPLFIVGTERSGSNLLRVILNAHSEIAIPHPPHIMAYFGPLERYYGDLSRDANLRRLLKDVLKHVRGHIHPWSVALNEEAILRAAEPRDLFGLFAAIYDRFCAAAGKSRWGCKSTFMIHCAARIQASYPGARLLWLIRDPRDVAVSSRDSVFNPFHPYYTARLWAGQQRLGLKLEATSGLRVMRVLYERLIREPELAVRQICDFAGVSFEPGMLRFFETPAARESSGWARDWRNTAQPILSNNSGKFKQGLSESEIAVVESVAGPLMEEFGNERASAVAPRVPSLIQRVGFAISNEAQRLKVELRSIRRDRNQRRRWARGVRMGLLRVRLALAAKGRPGS